MKILKKMGVILFITLLLFSFSISVFADNSVGSSARYYRPVVACESIGNYVSVEDFDNVTNIYDGLYSYASVFTPPTNVLIPVNMFYNLGQEFYLTNTSNWSGIYNSNFNGGVHQAVTSTRFYNVQVDEFQPLVMRSETEFSSYSNTNVNVVAFYDEVCVNRQYFDYQKEEYANKVFDGFVFSNSTANGSYVWDTVITVKWSQYVWLSDSEVPCLVSRSYSRTIDMNSDFYLEDIGRNTYESIAIPIFDYNNADFKTAIADMIKAPGTLGGDTEFYFTDIEVQIQSNNNDKVRMFSSYDETAEISSDVGGYMKYINVNINFDNFDMTSWLVNGVGAFMNFEIFPGFSLAIVFVAVLSLLLIKSFLRMFAGG